MQFRQDTAPAYVPTPADRANDKLLEEWTKKRNEAALRQMLRYKKR